MANEKKELTGLLDFFLETGYEGSPWAFQDSQFISPPEPGFPNGKWSHKGLHILEDGDHLTIYSKDNPQEEVWSGVISLRQCRPFTQKGINKRTWTKWFFRGLPAKLILARGQGGKK